MRKRSGKICATLLAVLLLTASLAAGAGAYFSDYETALGEVPIYLSGQTEVKESVADGKKTISIMNTGDSTVVVRVAVYGPDIMKVSFEKDNDWDKTQFNDLEKTGYYYYKSVLAPGEATSEIYAEVNIKDPTPEEKAALATLGDQFEIVVVQECAPAVYNENNVVMKPAYYVEENGVQVEKTWDHIPVITLE